MDIWGEKTTICIRVNEHYIYYAKVSKIGDPTDEIGGFSMYSWIKHLKEKVWWCDELEMSFINIASKMFE